MKILSSLSLLGFLAATAVAQPALAARTGVGLTITDITIMGTNARIFIANGISGTAPACSGSLTRHFGINLATNKGRALLNLATAAMLSGKTINVTGYDAASLNGATNTSGANAGCIAVDTTTVNFQELNQLSMNP